MLVSLGRLIWGHIVKFGSELAKLKCCRFSFTRFSAHDVLGEPIFSGSGVAGEFVVTLRVLERRAKPNRGFHF